MSSSNDPAPTTTTTTTTSNKPPHEKDEPKSAEGGERRQEHDRRRRRSPSPPHTKKQHYQQDNEDKRRERRSRSPPHRKQHYQQGNNDKEHTEHRTWTPMRTSTAAQEKRKRFALSKSLQNTLMGFNSVEQLVDICLSKSLPQMDAINCATVLNRFGKLRPRNRHASQTTNNDSRLVTAVRAILTRALEFVPKFEGRSIGNICHGIASGHLNDLAPDLAPQLMTAMVRQCDFSKFNEQNLSNTIWAFATLDMKKPELFRAVSNEYITRGFAKFKPQEISNGVWAFASIGQRDNNLFDSVATFLRERDLSEFAEQALVNIAWALATFNITQPLFFAHLANEICKRDLNKFTPQGLTNILWAFASVGAKQVAMVQLIVTAILRRGFQTFNHQDLCNCIYALAVLDIANPDISTLIAKEFCIKGFNKFSSQGLINAAWSFACMDLLQDPYVMEFFSATPPTHLFDRNMYTAKQWQQVGMAWTQSHEGMGYPALLKAAFGSDHWIDGFARAMDESTLVSSKTHLDVSATLVAMNYVCENEWVSSQGLAIDIRVKRAYGEGYFAVEVDGPSHFFPDGITATGATMFKRRLISNLMSLISIRVVDWTALDDAQKKIAFLREIFAQQLPEELGQDAPRASMSL